MGQSIVSRLTFFLKCQDLERNSLLAMITNSWFYAIQHAIDCFVSSFIISPLFTISNIDSTQWPSKRLFFIEKAAISWVSSCPNPSNSPIQNSIKTLALLSMSTYTKRNCQETSYTIRNKSHEMKSGSILKGSNWSTVAVTGLLMLQSLIKQERAALTSH